MKWLRCVIVTLCQITCHSAYCTSDIQLLPHQQKVFDYLEEYPELKGLILYHALGSGKTVTSLYYAKHQSKNIKILVPNYLKAQWVQEIKKIGIDPQKIEIYSYNKPGDTSNLEKIDFSESLVIIDEIQKLVERVRYSSNPSDLKVYWNLGKSKKILLLTGTPIFNDAADIGYIGNLIKGGSFFPFHPDEFKRKYMEINLAPSLFRGHLTESKLFSIGLPIYGSLLATSLSSIAGTSFAVPAIAMLSSSALNVTNQQFPIQQVHFRRFNASRFSGFANRYISFYETAHNDLSDYPSKTIHKREVEYTAAQVDFYMDFIDGVLPHDRLERIVHDETRSYTKAELRVRSAQIQQNILKRHDAGREIGNLSLTGPKGFEVSKKFIEVEKIISSKPGQVAIYSSYYHNGLVLFADFLKSKGHSFDVLHSDDTPEKMKAILDRFHTETNRILLIHPDITEGISLKGVEQFHLLEPVKNLALEKQIIGRSVRYLSHQHLPKERRHVDIYVWCSTVTYERFFLFPTDAGIVRRDHWLKRFQEVNPNLWSTGIAQLDLKYFEKDYTPDHHVEKNKLRIATDMQAFQQACRTSSLEHGVQTPENFLAHKKDTSTPLYQRPLVSFELGLYPLSYELTDTKTKEKRFEFTQRSDLGFINELPYSSHINVGFGMRFSSGMSTPYINNKKANNLTEALADISISLMNRFHVEPFSEETSSFFWKQEYGMSVFWASPFYGLSPSFRQSIGWDQRLLSHLSISAELGAEARAFFRTTTVKDVTDLEPKNYNTMKSFQPFIVLSMTSTYF